MIENVADFAFGGLGIDFSGLVLAFNGFVLAFQRVGQVYGIEIQRLDVVAVGAVLIFSDAERGDGFQRFRTGVYRNDASLDAEAGHGLNGLGFAVRIESGSGGGVNGVQNLVARHCFFPP